MAGNGGKRPGAGRKKGIPNKASIARQKKVALGGITPLDFMLDLMRKPIPKDADVAVQVEMMGQRFEAAKAAAPYVHPRLSTVAHSGPGGGPIALEVLFGA